MSLEIRCPRCGARYRLKPECVPLKPVFFRCQHCRHTFPYAPEDSKRGSPRPKSEEVRKEQSTTLPFDAADVPHDTAALATKATAEVEDPERDASKPHGEGAGLLSSRKPQRDEGDIAEDFTFEDDEYFMPQPRRGSRSDSEAPHPKGEPRGRKRGGKTAEVSRQDDRGPFRTLVLLVLAVVVFYALVTFSLFARPDRAQAFVASIPLIGQGVGEERLWARRVRLQEVEAFLREGKDGRPALIIAGKALNTATTPLQAVQLSAELLRSDGKVVDQKSVFIGNMVSARVLQDLSPQEISILQQLSPPRQFAIAPGEAASFAVVFFLDPSRHGEWRGVQESKVPAEFRLKVLAARRQS